MRSVRASASCQRSRSGSASRGASGQPMTDTICGASTDRLDRREPDREHRRAVQRAAQLAQRVQAMNRECLRRRRPQVRAASASPRTTARPRRSARVLRSVRRARQRVAQSISSSRCSRAHLCAAFAHSSAAWLRGITDADRSHAARTASGAKNMNAATTTSAGASPSTPPRPADVEVEALEPELLAARVARRRPS